MNTGIRQQIANAKTKTEVNDLLREASLITGMSPKTFRACQNTAARRKHMIDNSVKVAPVAPQQAEAQPNSKDRRAARRAALKGVA